MTRIFKSITASATFILVALTTILAGCGGTAPDKESQATEAAPIEVQKVVVIKYDLPIEDFAVTYDTIKPKQTIADMLYGLGFNANQIHKFTQCPDSIFNVRKIRPGQACALLCDKDSAATPRYFIYEESPKSYITFDLTDGYRAERKRKPVEWRESEVAGTVKSSLWFAMEENNASPLLAVEMSHIFGWSIDFFGIQQGDEFRVIYAQEFVENTPLNNYRILAASFKASGNLVYAIPFTQAGEELFYNSDGNSLEGAFLKAPLDYYRISSKFSNSRYHPVLKRRRAHHGVDYAAPKGTPVYAIGSGKVIKKAYQANGAGYYLKIRHNATYTTSYMHLSGYAKGLKEGDYVKQKQVIGYVGSTGLSTGPHLDFRVYENGKPINPLTIKSQPKMPINNENKEAFATVRDSLVNRLTGIPMATAVANNDSINWKRADC
ncbi:MAG: peptidoglycan DD-metalloendopeptidase family protein [Bacteroidaceae bacterium]|nr:peptidoglycan DD-metalloendopeptidase family protein [Bacteroidaceae bacterium]